MKLFNKASLINIQNKLQLDGKKISLIMLFVFMLIIYFDFRFIIKSQLNTLKRLEPKFIKLKADLDTLNKGFAYMRESKNKQTKIQHPLATGFKKLISEDRVHVLFQGISELANKNNVRIILMRPSRESPVPKLEKATVTEKFISLLVALDLICDYQSLVNFVNDLETNDILLVVQNIKIAPQQADILKQKVDLVLKTYVQK
jgi:Tfp pilus assembly protein PilO